MTISNPVIRVENLSKHYRLGVIGGATLREDLSRWWARKLNRPDPYAPVGEAGNGNGRGEIWALKDVSFEVSEGEILGIIGRNGAGKSTLLKILSRITAPTSGRAIIHGRVGSLLEVGTGFHPELTGRENIFLNGTILGMTKAEVARKLDEIVAFAEIEKFIDTPVKRYSSGMTVRLAFAVAAHLEPEILIIDEVLAVGDAAFQKKCLGKMESIAGHGRTILFVSHNMASIQKLCTRALWIRSGTLQYSGIPNTVIENYLYVTSETQGGDQEHSNGYLYMLSKSPSKNEDAYLISVRLVGQGGESVRQINTWNHIIFRVEFEIAHSFRSFAVVLKITTREGQTLILTSTTPDQTLIMSLDTGRYSIDCEFEQFPLAAGHYILGIGLARPGVEYVFLNDELCRIEVGPKDIFRSGTPPTCGRYLIAASHTWRPPQRQ